MTYLVAVEVDINIELIEIALSSSTAVAPERLLGNVYGRMVAYILSAVDLDLEGFV